MKGSNRRDETECFPKRDGAEETCRAEAVPRLYSIYLIQYVPDLTRAEVLTIGMVAYEPETRYLQSRFALDFEAIGAFHPEADREYLEELPEAFEDQICLHGPNLERSLGYVKTFSNLIQLAEPRFIWLNDPEGELNELLLRYVQKPTAALNRLAA